MAILSAYLASLVQLMTLAMSSAYDRPKWEPSPASLVQVVVLAILSMSLAAFAQLVELAILSTSLVFAAQLEVSERLSA